MEAWQFTRSSFYVFLATSVRLSIHISILFIELSDYNAETTTNKYTSEKSLTNYHVTLHIETHNYFGQNTSFLLELKRPSQQVLELSETKNSLCAIRARGWKLRSILHSNEQLIRSRSNQMSNCEIHGLVHKRVCDKSHRRKYTISDNTIDLNWAPYSPLQQPASQLLHAAVRVWRHLRERTVFYNERRLLRQASSAMTLQDFDLPASLNEIYKCE